MSLRPRSRSREVAVPPALAGRPKPDESAPYRSKRLLEPPGVRDGGCPRAGVPNARPDGVDGGAQLGLAHLAAGHLPLAGGPRGLAVEQLFL